MAAYKALINKKTLVIAFFAVGLFGFGHGYLITKKNHNDELNDARYLVDKNYILMKK